jgi:hypothetical protein
MPPPNPTSALDHELSRQARGACADRGANRHLATPCRRAGQLQAGHVRGRNREEQHHGAEQREQCRSHVGGHHVDRRHDGDFGQPLPPNIATAASPGSGARARVRCLRMPRVSSSLRDEAAPSPRDRHAPRALIADHRGDGPASTRVSRVGKTKSCGMTPTTVIGLPPT